MSVASSAATALRSTPAIRFSRPVAQGKDCAAHSKSLRTAPPGETTAPPGRAFNMRQIWTGVSAVKVDVLTLFPEMFSGPLDVSIVGRARNTGLLVVDVHNLR